MTPGTNRPDIDPRRYKVSWWNEQWLIECMDCGRASHIPDEPLSTELKLELLRHTGTHTANQSL